MTTIAEQPEQCFSGRLLLDYGWRFALAYHLGYESPEFDDTSWELVDLPHDWSIEGTRDRNNPMGRDGGYFPAGMGWYRRTFTSPQRWQGRRFTLDFEGVYMNADVWINGHHLGFHPYGYTSFAYDITPYLKYGEERNTLVVRVNNQEQLNSRWYSGPGIYRHVWLDVTQPISTSRWGVSVTTPQVSEQTASVRVRTRVENSTSERKTVMIHTRVLRPDGQVAGETSTEHSLNAGRTHTYDQVIAVSDPQLWSPDSPQLCRAEGTVIVDGNTVDQVTTVFGIRSIAWSSEAGLSINGEPIKLRGGCVHHDNGCLGAAAFDRAEERRVELLKSAGFNAIRCAHNPPSPAFLDACDQIGMIVIDEAFDYWELGKNPHDYSESFRDCWRHDIESMVLRDRNHPSVIMWSIGNEVVERAKESGARIARELASCVRNLDPTRPVTAAVCLVLDKGEVWTDTDDLFAALDICGYNYIGVDAMRKAVQTNQFQGHEVSPFSVDPNTTTNDRNKVTSRIIMETESFPKDAWEIWDTVQKNPWMLGDFVWTSYDYLGESGIGSWWHEGETEGTRAPGNPYPWHVAYCGDLDLCGFVVRNCSIGM